VHSLGVQIGAAVLRSIADNNDNQNLWRHMVVTSEALGHWVRNRRNMSLL